MQQHILGRWLATVYYCSTDDHAGALFVVISMLTSYFTWYLCRSNNVDFLRCGHVESDRVCWNGMKWNNFSISTQRGSHLKIRRNFNFLAQLAIEKGLKEPVVS